MRLAKVLLKHPKGRQVQIPEELLVLFIVHKLGVLGEQLLIGWKSSSAKGTVITCWCAGSAYQICFWSCIFLLELGGGRWGFHFYTWWKRRRCAVRKGLTSNPTGKRSRHNSLFYKSPSSIQTSLAAKPRRLHGPVWLLRLSFTFPACSSCEGAHRYPFLVFTRDVWEARLLFALWIIQRGRSGKTQDVQSSHSSRAAAHESLVMQMFAHLGRNGQSLQTDRSTLCKLVSWGDLSFISVTYGVCCSQAQSITLLPWRWSMCKGSKCQLCCILGTVVAAAVYCWNSHGVQGSQALLGCVCGDLVLKGGSLVLKIPSLPVGKPRETGKPPWTSALSQKDSTGLSLPPGPHVPAGLTVGLFLPPCWQDRAVPRVPVPLGTRVPPRAVLALSYQVACGTGEPRAVHARVTSMLSQTACARSGIQSMGARPARSSRSSFSRRAFSIACDRRHWVKAGQREVLLHKFSDPRDLW